jgi:3'-phosphoadenosine 5'-phosphosulfate sulfotransferase (PAPS reductase)/FAD synthetase
MSMTFPYVRSVIKQRMKSQAISDEFEGASPEVVLEWADEEFGTDVALATGFGAEGRVLVSILADPDAQTRCFYLDTDLLFPET